MSKPFWTRSRSSMPWCGVAACLILVVQSGCTSALTAAYLRDGVWGGAEHAAAADDAPPAGDEATATDAPKTDAPVAVDDDRREAALEEAMTRLSRLGTLDPAVEAALVATLQRTQPEDWPVVVDEFAASLPAAGSGSTTTSFAAPAATDEPAATAEPPAEATAASAPEADVPAKDAPATPAAEPASPSEAAAADPAAPESVSAPAVAVAAPLAVRQACFASAVRAWGDVDRFAADRFRPGQEVIIYVEIDNLAAGDSPAGHTTCIDSVLRLVDAGGRTLHTWNFDPIAETCAARRRDYFARYLVRIPDSVPPGGCRVEMSVTDTIAGATADAALPLEIAAAD